MSYDDSKRPRQPGGQASQLVQASVPAIAPGKRTRTASLPSGPGGAPPPVQQKPDSTADATRQERAELTARWLDTATRPDLYSPPPVQRKRADGTAQPQQTDAAAVPTSARWAEPIPMMVTARKLRIRSTPDTSNDDNVVGRYTAGTRMDVWGKEGDWLIVNHEGAKAYIHGAYVEPVSVPMTRSAAASAGANGSAAATAPTATSAAEGQGEVDLVTSVINVITTLLRWLDEVIPESSETQEKQPFGAETSTEASKQESTDTASGGTLPAAGAPTPAGKSSTRLFAEAFEVVDPDARLRAPNGKETGKKLPVGTKVYVVEAERTRVQIVTAPGAAEVINESDNLWTAFVNLGGTGANVALGNEKTDPEAEKKADALRALLPEGRNPGKSPYKWQFSGYFQPSLEGKTLDSSLMTKVHRLMQWAIDNDMVTGDITISDGVRGPKTAHRICVAWEIQHGPGRVTFEDVKALPGGKDADGTTWYKDGWTWEQVQENANSIRSSNKIAAAGYDLGDPRRAPLPISSRPGVSRHCTGRAVDVTIPWRVPGVHASKNKSNVWAWEEIYKQFGLHRPLHKDLVSSAKLQENWHIEETGMKLHGNDDTDE